MQKSSEKTTLYNLIKNDYNGPNIGVCMQHSVRTISSSDAKANLGDVLSSLNTHGPIEITRNGKSVGLLTLPPVQALDRSRIATLAVAYSKGLISWPQIAEETGASYGDLLIALGLKNLQIPKVTPKNRPEQVAFFNRILDAAAAKGNS
jgi:hypothetical protein